MVDLRAQLGELREEIREAVGRVIDSGTYILGPAVGELEERIAEYTGARHAIGVSSGTDALLVALMALGVGPGDLVLTTAYSFFATAGAPARLGAAPVFLDIDPATCNLSPEALAAWLQGDPARARRVKAIIPVHLFGQCADMDRILRLAAGRGIPVVEDAAQALGATNPSPAGARKAGTLGALGTFSFFPSKNLGGIGDGGMVITDDDELAERARRLRVHGAKPKYHHAMVGGNFRLDTVQAAALLVKLPHLERWHAARRERAAYYDARLERPGLRPPPCPRGREHHVYNQYVVSVDKDRDGLRRHLAEEGVASAVFYPVPFHLQACFAHLGYRRGDLPESERAAERTLALPIYPELTAEMQDHVISAISRYLG